MTCQEEKTMTYIEIPARESVRLRGCMLECVHLYVYVLNMCVCVHMCKLQCVCVCERERECAYV